MREIGNGAVRLGAARERRAAVALAEGMAILVAVLLVVALVW